MPAVLEPLPYNTFKHFLNWCKVMIVIYQQSSELLIFCVLLLNRGPTFTFKMTCGAQNVKICPKVVLEFELSCVACFTALQHFSGYFGRG